jgi:hypothetical protein
MSCTLLPIYWGSSASTTLSAAQVQALGNTREQINKLGVYGFGDSDTNRYLWFASPQAFGRVNSFLFGYTPDAIGSLNLVPIESEITLTVDGESVAYFLYRSPDLVIGEAALEIN